MRTAVAILLCLFGTGGQVHACSIMPPTAGDFLANKRVKQKADCSFVNGGIYDEYFGEAARDLGDGRVMQRLAFDRVILTDCSDNMVVLVLGKADPAKESSCGPEYKLERFEAPNGQLDYKVGSDLAEFIEIIGRQDFVAYASPDLNRGERRRDIVDYTCGCKLFYPESFGPANQQ